MTTVYKEPKNPIPLRRTSWQWRAANQNRWDGYWRNRGRDAEQAKKVITYLQETPWRDSDQIRAATNCSTGNRFLNKLLKRLRRHDGRVIYAVDAVKLRKYVDGKTAP